ncbi:CarD family transcriptional regulator [Geothermobacter hydrogeniphilus]|uniref:CarD family transcriptional regulator n=1 Tax=Geothermobacter hydrogeniphilus TaxID=1969733 RepID=A0A1X0XZE1_9BACT|nr:CarD family transcriptional regulator [Geothermobacter hydrogeniphilus]ORJ58301.1 CarD family transcriptional regulator [Geothermobacter hydrogeniphilus]PNU18716.1 CarD family transcriptional regulator [Geothermobacter hydrogeniphilus]
MQKTNEFKIGDRAVYPSQGVGVIEAIESREFSGVENKFYVLRIVDSDMTIMVPVGNVSQVGLRRLVNKKQVATVYELLEDKADMSGGVASWSRRQREYNEKIKSGDLMEVAEVLRELYLIKEDKELSYGEKKVLELARKLLVSEIALAEGKAEEKIAQRVESMLLN